MIFGLMTVLLASFAVSCKKITDNRQNDAANWENEAHQLFLKAQSYYNTIHQNTMNVALCIR